VLRAPDCRGFTLVEITLAISMMLIVSGAVYQTLTLTQRLTRSQGQQVNVQSSVRSAALVLANEFRPLGAGVGLSGGESDLTSIAPTAVTYRAERGFGALCQAANAGRIRISRQSFSGYRDPQAGRDSVSVFVEGNAASPHDDLWTPLALTSVGAGSCPAGALPGIELTVWPAAAVEGLPPGTPVRIHELVELRLYRSDGRSWIGMRSLGSNESIQPLSGPVRDRDGVQFDFLGPAGLAAAARSEVRGIRFTVRGESEATADFGATRGEHVAEELSFVVGLRNAAP
jgi:prepilin-type N-terminal cleavage/methylation domain-containing protein